MNHKESKEVSKPSWKNASGDQRLEYNVFLLRNLSSMNIPKDIINCSDIHCESEKDKKKID